jgi:hypothetical protein
MSRALFNEGVFDHIRRMVAEGQKPAEIARVIGCTEGTLRVKCSINKLSLQGPNGKRRRWARRPPEPEPNHPIQFELPRSVMGDLSSFAKKRGVSRNMLVTQLLELVVRDNLYMAVLDDKEVA